MSVKNNCKVMLCFVSQMSRAPSNWLIPGQERQRSILRGSSSCTNNYGRRKITYATASFVTSSFRRSIPIPIPIRIHRKYEKRGPQKSCRSVTLVADLTYRHLVAYHARRMNYSSVEPIERCTISLLQVTKTG